MSSSMVHGNCEKQKTFEIYKSWNQEVPLVPLHERWVLGIFLCITLTSMNVNTVRLGFLNHHHSKHKISRTKGENMQIWRCTYINEKKLKDKHRSRNHRIPVRLAVNFVIRVPVMANPTRNGQLRLNSLLKKIGHGSNFLIFPLSLVQIL